MKLLKSKAKPLKFGTQKATRKSFSFMLHAHYYIEAVFPLGILIRSSCLFRKVLLLQSTIILTYRMSRNIKIIDTLIELTYGCK